jgi:starch phosphorylase
MANVAVVGSCSTNGVAAIHSRLLRDGLMRDFSDYYPERFNNKTNGVTPRRWLLKANPRLSSLIRDKIGDRWITDLDQLRGLEPFAKDEEFRAAVREVKLANKIALSDYIKRTLNLSVPPESMFQAQVKRIHEYKRQLLLCLLVIILYDRLKANPSMEVVPQTFIFGGKAAPGYHMAKLIIKLIHQVAGVINYDPEMRDRLKLVFLPDYRVSLAEKIIPAADVSVQISTAGTEASGTGNMKFAMNGALTIGTLDGANIEIKEEVGDENIFIFGLTTEEVEAVRRHYNPWDYYESDEEICRAIDLIRNDFFSLNEPGIFRPIISTLLEHGDHYMHMADLRSFMDAQQRLEQTYQDAESWSEKAVINIARTGKFSSDRTIAEYNREIWHCKAVDVRPPAAQTGRA